MNFNAHQVAPSTAPEPVPSGIYIVAITKSEEVPVQGKAGNSYYQFTLTIQDGEHKGRAIIERLNVKNDNAQAVDIAYGTLSAICHVTGTMVVGQSSDELHGKPFKVNVVKVPRNDDPTKERNEIRGYLDMAGNPPTKTGTTVTHTAGVATGQQAAQAAAFAQPQATQATPQATQPAAVQQTASTTWVAMPNNPGYDWELKDNVPTGNIRPTPAQQPAVQQASQAPAWTPNVPYQENGVWHMNGVPMQAQVTQAQPAATQQSQQGGQPSWAQ